MTTTTTPAIGRMIYQVNAFTDRPFAGNPAAVYLMEQPRDAAWMQGVAREMNLSETAFLLPRPDGDGYDLRWFTPTTEVDLCGHATLASAHVLWETRHLAPDAEARFHTRSGLLTARLEDGWITLDFPATPAAPAEAPDDLLAALGMQPLFVGRSAFDYLVELPNEVAVHALRPDMARLRRVPARGLIVTSLPDGGPYDFVSRFFAPAAGVDEDPVTGSAHCALGPYWQPRLGKDEMLAYQASARGGEVRVRMVRGSDRVLLGGRAVTVLRGELDR